MLLTLFKLVVIVIAIAITLVGVGLAINKNFVIALSSLVPAFIASVIMTGMYFNQSGDLVTMWPFVAVGIAMAARSLQLFFESIPPRLIDMPSTTGSVVDASTVSSAPTATAVGAAPRHWIAS